MRILVAVSAIALAACYGPGGNADTTRVDSTVVSAPAIHDSTPRTDTGNVPAGVDLELRTDKPSYRGGEQMMLTLVNPTSSSYAYNPCTRLLERESGSGWVEVREERICTMIAHILAPRSRRTENTELTAGLEPGRYRVILSLTVEGSGVPSRSVRISAPINVTR